MADESTPFDSAGSGCEAEGLPILPLEAEVEEAHARGWWRLRALRDRVSRLENSAAGRYWSHLSTADFMNSSLSAR
jgi:hypothetical protein